MKGLFKKLVAGVCVVTVMSSAGIIAGAQSEMDNMVFAGYDTTDPYNPNKIYNEVIGGHYTNKQILVPVTPEWRAEGYENVYPYAGYSRMYLEGKKQDITAYNNLFPQWETRKKDYFWEIKWPYRIWERQQTKVNNKTWQWDFGNDAFGIPDSAVKNRTNRYAVVTDVSFKDYGFGKYDANGNVLTQNEQYMYSQFFVTDENGGKYFITDAIATWNNLVNGLLSASSLSAKDANNRFVVRDEDIEAMIPVVESKFVTAKFSENSKDGLAKKSVAAEFLQHMSDGWDWDYDTSFKFANTAKVSWSKQYYEMAEPYNYYQFLIVNGVVMDGTNGKDRIYRYTGGKASPKITWKFAFFQNAKDENGNILSNVYEVVERKYVDGVAAIDTFGNPIYRVPTGEYGNTYFIQKGTTIEYWVVDKNGNKTLLGKADNFTGNLGALNSLTGELTNLIDAYADSAYNYKVSI